MSSISIAEAAEYYANWKSFNSKNSVGGYPMNQIFPNAYTSEIADINAILANNPAKLRIYFGYDSDKPTPEPGSGTFPMKIMLVGVNAQGQDIINTSGVGPTGIYDHCAPCPVNCDNASPINTYTGTNPAT
jgi:hypothetical protein